MKERKALVRVNGSRLSDFRGKDVCLLGLVARVDSSGRRVTLGCSGDAEVDVSSASVLQTSPENCVVEAVGMVVNSAMIGTAGL